MYLEAAMKEKVFPEEEMKEQMGLSLVDVDAHARPASTRKLTAEDNEAYSA